MSVRMWLVCTSRTELWLLVKFVPGINVTLNCAASQHDVEYEQDPTASAHISRANGPGLGKCLYEQESTYLHTTT